MNETINILTTLLNLPFTILALYSIFLLFIFERIDNYVDNRKNIIRSILKNKKPTDEIFIRIQEIGIKNTKDDVEYFKKFNRKDIDHFSEDIIKFRNFRDNIKCAGIINILYWSLVTLLQLIYILNINCFSFLSFLNMKVFIIFYIIGMIFSIIIIIKCLCRIR